MVRTLRQRTSVCLARHNYVLGEDVREFEVDRLRSDEEAHLSSPPTVSSARMVRTLSQRTSIRLASYELLHEFELGRHRPDDGYIPSLQKYARQRPQEGKSRKPLSRLLQQAPDS